MWPIIATRPAMFDVNVRCRSLILMFEVWLVHKPPRLELELVSAKRLSDRLWRPMWRMNDKTCTEVTFHHTF